MTKTPAQPGRDAPAKPTSTGAAKPKRKLELEVNDIDSVLERKISP
ncbi:MAG TPA: hypothetical protein VK698_00960 [Kofleriaceae bacterium]|nr:hypothetical protein [Kofleriaceae bacterium]